MLKIKKSKIRYWVAVCNVFILLYCTSSIYNLIWSEYHLLMRQIMVLFQFGLLIDTNLFKYANRIKSFLVFSIVFLVWSFLNSGNAEMGIILRIIAAVTLVIWAYEQDVNLLKVIYDVVVVIAIIYLFFYVFYDYGLSGIKPVMVPLVDETGKKLNFYSYSGIYFRWQNYRPILGYQLIGSNGPFHEPGMYQILLNFALVYMWFTGVREKKYKAVVLITAIISTTSTMGILIMISTVFWKNMDGKKAKNVMWKIILYGSGVGFLSLMLMIEKASTASMSSRIQNLLYNLQLLQKNPLWGCGITQNTWNALLGYFVNFGLLGLVPVLLFLYGNWNGIFSKKWNGKCAYLIWWLGSMINEGIGYLSFMFVLYGMCVVHKNRTRGLGCEKENIKHIEKKISKTSKHCDEYKKQKIFSAFS